MLRSVFEQLSQTTATVNSTEPVSVQLRSLSGHVSPVQHTVSVPLPPLDSLATSLQSQPSAASSAFEHRATSDPPQLSSSIHSLMASMPSSPTRGDVLPGVELVSCRTLQPKGVRWLKPRCGNVA